MKDEFARLLRLRFDERNRQMVVQFTEVKQRLNARGILYSSETVNEMHKVLEAELKASAEVVVTTAMDVITKEHVLLAEQQLKEFCANAFLKRKEEIESMYLADVRQFEQVLQNKAMLQPYMSLGDFYSLQREEMLIRVASEVAPEKRTS